MNFKVLNVDQMPGFVRHATVWCYSHGVKQRSRDEVASQGGGAGRGGCGRAAGLLEVDHEFVVVWVAQTHGIAIQAEYEHDFLRRASRRPCYCQTPALFALG
ncbi:hypothetical protein ABZP36_000929 [Zizania latifolia]